MAVIAILASLLLPALAKARLRAQTVSCLSGKRQLITAWLLYSQDHGDWLAPNYPKPISGGWVNGQMSWGGVLISENTNTLKLTDALLGPYTAKQTRIYHCPADRSCGVGQSIERIRSVSMNAFVGSPGPTYPATNYIFAGWRQFIRLSDIKNPTGVFVFLDEHPDCINDGWFIYCTPKGPPETSEWSDLPGSYHDRAGCFVFADGHAEVHKWKSSGTIKPNCMNGIGGLPLRVPASSVEQQDILWVRDRSTCKIR